MFCVAMETCREDSIQKWREAATLRYVFSTHLSLGKPCSYGASCMVPCRLERRVGEGQGSPKSWASLQKSSGRSGCWWMALNHCTLAAQLSSARTVRISEQRRFPLVVLAAGRLQPLAPASSPARQSVWKAPCQGSCWHRGSALVRRILLLTRL